MVAHTLWGPEGREFESHRPDKIQFFTRPSLVLGLCFVGSRPTRLERWISAHPLTRHPHSSTPFAPTTSAAARSVVYQPFQPPQEAGLRGYGMATGVEKVASPPGGWRGDRLALSTTPGLLLARI